MLTALAGDTGDEVRPSIVSSETVPELSKLSSEFSAYDNGVEPSEQYHPLEHQLTTRK